MLHKAIGFVIFFLPLLSIGQFNGLSYNRKSFELDSLLSIAKDTGNYTKTLEAIVFQFT